MSALDLVVAMAVVAAVVFSLMSDPSELSAGSRRRPAARPSVRVRQRQRKLQWAPGASLVGDLVLVERLGGRTLGLDCLLRAPGPAARATGGPVHIRARCSVAWWAAERFMHLVGTWAYDPEPVTVEIVPYRGNLRAKVSHGESCLILDVVNADDLVLAAQELRAAA